MAEKRKPKRVYSSAMLFAINSTTKRRTTTVVPTQETTATVNEPARTVDTIDPLKKQCFVALSDVFKTLKSLEKFWVKTERAKAEQETPQRKPFQNFVAGNRGSLAETRRNLSSRLRRKEEREAARLRVEKMKRTVFVDDNLHSFKELEKMCGYCLADSRISIALMEDIGLVLKQERESGSLAGAKWKFQSGNEEANSVEMQARKKDREAARMRVEKMKRTVFVDDNLHSFKELEKMCGYCLADSRISNALMEDIGLVLKPERESGSLAGTKRKFQSGNEEANSVEMQARKKDREAARMRVEEMKRTVFLDESMTSFKELQKLCGTRLHRFG